MYFESRTTAHGRAVTSVSIPAELAWVSIYLSYWCLLVGVANGIGVHPTRSIYGENSVS